MIAKKFRLKRSDLALPLEKGETLHSKLFIIKYLKNNENFSRYCVIISRKISNKAVVRNKLRRQAFEAIAKIEKLEKNQNFDIVLIPRKQILESSYKDIEEDLQLNIFKLK
jgi:ribonuclease P protein component